MSLRLSKTDTSPYDYVSDDGTMSNPIVCNVTIDKSGGTVTGPATEFYLVATNEGTGEIGSYSNIYIDPTATEASTEITWEVSLDGNNFFESVEPNDMDVSSGDEVTTLFARIVANNATATSLATGNYAAEFQLDGVENPPE